MSFEILDDRGDRSLLVVHGDEPDRPGNYVEVISAPCQAYESNTEENYITKVHFHRTRESWYAAWRIARLLANATPQLIAVLDQWNIDACAEIDFSWFHKHCYTIPGKAAA